MSHGDDHDKDNGVIPTMDREESYSTFAEKCLHPNRPVILKGLCKGWPASRDWVDGSSPHILYLKEHFGEARCEVATCDKQDFSDQQRQSMLLSEYIDYWLSSDKQAEKRILYLKDWHYVREFPAKIAYKLPRFFADDWINYYWDRCRQDDDYRFVYIGPKGSWTPLHSDVFNTYSWSCNIVGRKKWILYDPSQGPYLKDIFGKNLIYDVEKNDYDKKMFPLFHKASPIVLYQEAGETVFIPSGWYHQVSNVEDTISINHNWANGWNLHLVWARLLSDLRAVQNELEDLKACEDYVDECQKVLKLYAGWDIADFLDFLYCNAQPQLDTTARYPTTLQRIMEIMHQGHSINKEDETTEIEKEEEARVLMAVYNLTQIYTVLKAIHELPENNRWFICNEDIKEGEANDHTSHSNNSATIGNQARNAALLARLAALINQ